MNFRFYHGSAEPFLPEMGDKRASHVAVVGDAEHERTAKTELLRQTIRMHAVERLMIRMMRNDRVRFADRVFLAFAHRDLVLKPFSSAV
jgi:hypothetical protein